MPKLNTKEPIFSEHSSSLYVIRFPSLHISENALLATCESLIKQTHYYYKSEDAQAPQKANCVTAIRYIFKKCMQQLIPRVWIGDMPRILLMLGGTLQKTSIKEMQTGDLLFLRYSVQSALNEKNQFITHMVMALKPNLIFHCAEKRKGCVLENLITPIDNYAATLQARVVTDPSLLLRYIDPRNLKQRRHHTGPLMTFPIPKARSKPFFTRRLRKIIYEYTGQMGCL